MWYSFSLKNNNKVVGYARKGLNGGVSVIFLDSSSWFNIKQEEMRAKYKILHKQSEQQNAELNWEWNYRLSR